MKPGQILLTFTLTGMFSIAQALFSFQKNNVNAQTARPYAVFVNGWKNCCAWKMESLQERLGKMNIEIRSVPYSNFIDGGKSDLTSKDLDFMKEGANFINEKLDKNRPLILIGHSFGGDSIIKLIPKINRKIQFVAVLDPVSTGGFRYPLRKFNISDNVDYFFNRWQSITPFPVDFPLNGSISCNARIKCDQEKYNVQRLKDSSPEFRECTAEEKKNFQCPTSGLVEKQVTHSSLPTDAYLQRQIGDIIQERFIESKSLSGDKDDDTIDKIKKILKDLNIPSDNLKNLPFPMK